MGMQVHPQLAAQMQMQMHPQMQGGFGGAYYQQQILAHMQSWQQQQQQMTQMAMMGYPQTQMHPQQPAPPSLMVNG